MGGALGKRLILIAAAVGAVAAAATFGASAESSESTGASARATAIRVSVPGQAGAATGDEANEGVSSTSVTVDRV